MMNCDRARSVTAVALILSAVCLAPCLALAQAGTITPDMQRSCTNDYKRFCGDYGLQSNALNNCMRKAGPQLSPACVQALVKAGKVSQGEVDKLKAARGM